MMLKQIKYSLVILAASVYFNLYADEIIIRRIPVATRLPTNTVYRLFQDRDGFVWIGTPDGFCRYDAYEMKSFRSELAKPVFPSNYITGGFAEDTLNQTIWIGTGKGVLILDKRTLTIAPLDTALLGQSLIRQILYSDNAMWVCSDFDLYLYNTDKTLKKKYPGSANSIHIDNRGTVRITVWEGGIYYLDKVAGSFIPYPPIGRNNNPHKIFQDSSGNLWVCTWGDGLYRFHPDRYGQDMYEYVDLPYGKNLNFEIFYDIEQDDVNGYLWTLSYAGVTVFTVDANRIVQVNDRAVKINNETNLFSDIMKDRDGNLWLGTYHQGIILVNPNKSTVANHDLLPIKAQTGYIPNIVKVFEDKDGEFWLRQNRLGIYLFNPEHQKIRDLDIPAINAANAICNCSALDEIWVATDYYPNIQRVRKQNGKFTLAGTFDLHTVYPGNITAVRFLHEDRQGAVWAAANNILFLWKQGKWHVVTDSCGTITGITEDSEGAIWFSTAGNGLWRIKTDKDRTNPENYNTNTCRIAGNNISCINADSCGQVWFCVNEKQLYSYDITKQQFTDHSQKANINDLVIFNIIAGDNKRVWILSDKQIVEFNPSTCASIQYDVRNDLIVTSLNENSMAKMHDGSIAFGGNRGLCILTPSPKLDTLDMPDKKTGTAISDIKINGKSIYQRDVNSQNPGWQKELVLLPNEINLEIDFSSFNYLNPGKIRYAYKLEGVDGSWIYTESGRNFAVYNQLRKGTYTFLVRSTEENHLWSDEITRLIIIKKPKFYETAWAYTAYAIVILLILLSVVKFYTNRVKWRNELLITRIDKEKSEELIQTKLRFFTNIGHEFRTPLTLIMTPLNTLIHQLTDENLKQKLSAIYRNAEDLLILINQLLDFRKLEMGGEKLKLSCDDFVKFAEYIYLTFKDVAANKSIQFTFESDVRQLFISFDKSKVRKIINNLYSNALKFTPEDGYIDTTLRLVRESGREYIRLDVADSGVGISDKEQQTIFERFYQSENNTLDKTGSGIGLHLVKEYVELHGGQITLNSQLGKGSAFSICIPTDLQVLDRGAETKETDSGEPLPASEPEPADNHETKTLLIVEDNAELRNFLVEQLRSKFNVLEAVDGKQGAGIALKKFPDLIVSDLMMPVLNGLEMCQRLKNDVQTSHIPVILLTAKFSDEAKIETYKAGADSYIAKPFNFEVLLARIEMLIEQQEKRKKLVHKTIEIAPGSIATTSLDEELIKKALLDIEKNINNSRYLVDDLAAALSFSPRQLSRKFRAIIGLSPNDLIRSVRLKRAAQLLKDTQYNVSEIAYMVGFSTIKYFNTNFKDEFGVTPTQYRTEG